MGILVIDVYHGLLLPALRPVEEQKKPVVTCSAAA
jgi:hypothetical protein